MESLVILFRSTIDIQSDYQRILWYCNLHHIWKLNEHTHKMVIHLNCNVSTDFTNVTSIELRLLIAETLTFNVQQGGHL